MILTVNVKILQHFFGFSTLQDSVATYCTWGHEEFSYGSDGERILKIGPHLPKLLSNLRGLVFMRQCTRTCTYWYWQSSSSSSSSSRVSHRCRRHHSNIGDDGLVIVIVIGHWARSCTKSSRSA